MKRLNRFHFFLYVVVLALTIVAVFLHAQQLGVVFPAAKIPAQVVSRNTALASTTILGSQATQVSQPGLYIVELYAYDSAAGAGCTGNSTVTWTFSYTDPTNTAQTSTATETITTNGGATGGDALKTTLPLDVNGGSNITASTAYTAGAGCTTNPSYAADLKLLF